MPGKDKTPNPYDATVPDVGHVAPKPPPLPRPLPLPGEPTIVASRVKPEEVTSGVSTQPLPKPVGSFTTSLAALAHKIRISIPERFYASGTKGKLLRLVPVQHLRGKSTIELYFKCGPTFSIGRSAEADWVSCFFPRNERNDQRSKRLSKIHAQLEFRDDKLWVHRAGSAKLQIEGHEVGADPKGLGLREMDQVILAEDYSLEIYYDISLQGTLRFVNGDRWQVGQIKFDPRLLGAVRFEPVNSALGYRNSCWLFVDVGFGSARGGVLTAGSELAPQQGVFLMIGGCFWVLNLVNNEKVRVSDYHLAAHEIVPLTQGDSIWLGAIRYRAEIG